jgi:hypothetical protein
VGLLLSACGFTAAAGTNFNIYIEGDHEESAAPIGILAIGEAAQLRFQIKKSGQDPVNHTAAATFELSAEDSDDRPANFNLTLSTDLAARPYHTISTYVYDVKTHVCATYDGPEALGETIRVCREVWTYPPEWYED